MSSCARSTPSSLMRPRPPRRDRILAYVSRCDYGLSLRQSPSASWGGRAPIGKPPCNATLRQNRQGKASRRNRTNGLCREVSGSNYRRVRGRRENHADTQPTLLWARGPEAFGPRWREAAQATG
jgi:hypothetical protein